MNVHVVMVPVDLAVQRVLERLRRGGPTVPEQKIRDRCERQWGSIGAAIRCAATTEGFDNSSAHTPFRRCVRCTYGPMVGTPSRYSELTGKDADCAARCAERR